MEVAAVAGILVVGTHCALNDTDDTDVFGTLDAALRATLLAAHIHALSNIPSSSGATVDAFFAVVVLVVRGNVRCDTKTMAQTFVENMMAVMC